MKTNYIFIALAMVAALTMVSCGDNKKAQNQEPTQEEIQAQKQALADSVLAEIDAFAEEYFSESANSFSFRGLELTEGEKLAKPDYLLDPSVASSLVTKTQKVNALAYYCVDLGVRILYDMPTEETKEAIAKLAMDVNFPVDIDQYEANVPKSERIKAEYLKCKERSDLAYFWQFQNAVIVETSYLLTQNPELFFSNITEPQWQSYYKKLHNKTLAIRKLAQYDEEMSEIRQQILMNRVSSSDEEYIEATSSINSAIEYFRNKQDKYIARRNALLQ